MGKKYGGDIPKSRLKNFFKTGVNNSFPYLGEEKSVELMSYLCVEDNDIKWNWDKLKAIFKITSLKDSEDVKKILSYLDQPIYGWNGDEYCIQNKCKMKNCKKLIGASEHMEKLSSDIDKILGNPKYGAITTYLFGYCIAGQFTSKLVQQKSSLPYFLQIACERNSGSYKLVNQIIEICNVNAGMLEYCNGEFGYQVCGYGDFDNFTIFPEKKLDTNLENLLNRRDILTTIEGYENKDGYKDILRAIVNMSGSKERLGNGEKLKTSPIFLCENILSEFKNVFSIDLTEMDVESEYLDLLKKNEQYFASWIFELITKPRSYFNDTDVFEKENDEYLLNGMKGHFNKLRKKYGHLELPQNDMWNISLLTYFLVHFMRVFENINIMSDNKGQIDRKKIITTIHQKMEELLLELHDGYSPKRSHEITLDIDIKEEKERNKIKEKCQKYLKDIIKYYQGFKVSIRIAPQVEYQNGRFIFQIKMVPGTKESLIFQYKEDVRRLLNVEFLEIDKEQKSIRIIISEKPLKENSLIRILESDKFQAAKAKIPYAVGYDILGEMVIADVAEFPHLLIGGASGSGKSCGIHSLIMSIVWKQPVERVRVLLFDYGASGLKIFKNVPHLLTPVLTAGEIEESRQSILWLQKEMERRLKIKDSLDIKNQKKEMEKWSFIVCVIDEFPAFIRQLISEGYKETGKIIDDILARARKVKIHLVLAAQDATKDNIKIKNTNFGAAIAFKCMNVYASQAIIGEATATKLSGKGAMYFKCDEFNGIKRLQGAFMPEEEIMDKLEHIKFQQSKEGYNVMQCEVPVYSKLTCSTDVPDLKNDNSDKMIRLVKYIQSQNKISNNMIKKFMHVGYDVADKYLKDLEEKGFISPAREGVKLPREIYQGKVSDFLKSYGYNDFEETEDKEDDLNMQDVNNNRELVESKNNITDVTKTNKKISKIYIPKNVLNSKRAFDPGMYKGKLSKKVTD